MRYHGTTGGRVPPRRFGSLLMMQCEQCEFFRQGEHGEASFSCDPFRNVKEPECLAKWQLIKINQMVAAYQSTLAYYQKLAPMQEKMFKVMEREIDDMSESDKWKVVDDDDEDDTDEEQHYDTGSTWNDEKPH
jgi:hypothetical protein